MISLKTNFACHDGNFMVNPFISITYFHRMLEIKDCGDTLLSLCMYSIALAAISKVATNKKTQLYASLAVLVLGIAIRMVFSRR